MVLDQLLLGLIVSQLAGAARHKVMLEHHQWVCPVFFSARVLDPVAILSELHEETREVMGRVQVEEEATSL